MNSLLGPLSVSYMYSENTGKIKVISDQLKSRGWRVGFSVAI